MERHGRRRPTDVYLETGKRRTFAGAIDWRGWARSWRDDDAALEALPGYGPRYARVLRGTRLGFEAPTEVRDLRVVERREGDATTDFGAPAMAPRADRGPFDDAEYRRARSLLTACWRGVRPCHEGGHRRGARTGPRGGGRKLDAVVAHVADPHAAYLRKLATKLDPDDGNEPTRARRATLDGLARAVKEGVPERGPRGGRLWTPRYFVRRAAWHMLDHAWEIEDRTERGPQARSAPNGSI